jgi:hypothetical protein
MNRQPDALRARSEPPIGRTASGTDLARSAVSRGVLPGPRGRTVPGESPVDARTLDADSPFSRRIGAPVHTLQLRRSQLNAQHAAGTLAFQREPDAHPIQVRPYQGLGPKLDRLCAEDRRDPAKTRLIGQHQWASLGAHAHP